MARSLAAARARGRAMRRVRAVIYDLDGTLLDTEPLFIEATNAILARFGKRLDPAVRAQMVGRPNPVAARIFVEGHRVPLTPEAFLAERSALLAPRFAAAPPLPGAVELTAHLRAHGVPQAVATSSDRTAFAQKARGRSDWFDTFDAVLTMEDATRGKPAPDLFLEAARRLGLLPGDCLVFEDAPLGVEAALAAGMATVALPEPGHETMVGGADLVLGSLLEFEPEAWGLPSWREGLRSGASPTAR